MIEARELTKRYGGTVAVDEVSFTVKPGQVTGFLGPNGAGKSTTSARGITLVELAPVGSSLEAAYFELTKYETDYHGGHLVDATIGA